MRDKILLSLIAITALVIIGIGFLIFKQKQNQDTSLLNASEILAITESDWVYNKGEGKLTLVEYSDFQCPACAYYKDLISQLKKDYPDKLQIVYRHYPLASHKNARIAARASEAAGRQGKFWEMHDRLFDTQKEWENLNNPKDKFKQLAIDIGLDVDKFMVDLNDSNLDANIQSGIASGNKLNIKGTPTFFLNGEKIPNPKGYQDFKNIIESY